MKSKQRLIGGALCLLLGCLASCEVKRPDVVLSDARMSEVLYDYHLAKAMGDEKARGESYKRVLFVESVYRKHGIDQATFDTSMVWYSRHPAKLAKVYDQVNARLRATRDGVNHLIALREEKVKETQPGDSMEVWAWRPAYRLTGVPMANKLMFVLQADANFEPRDTLRWTVRLQLMDEEKELRLPPLMTLQMAYEKDTVLTAYHTIERSGRQTLSLAADTMGAIKEVRGCIYLPARSRSRVAWIDRISLMRYHAHDSLVVATDSTAVEADTIPAQPAKTVEQEPEQQPAQPTPRQPRRPRPNGVLRESGGAS